MIYDSITYFLIYSFLGWCLEVIYAAVQKKRFVNRGLLSGPLCPVYGLSMVFLLTFFNGLSQQPLFLFFACITVISVFEWGTGVLLERLLGYRCWDYSRYRDHIGSYVCLRFSAIWALMAVAVICVLHDLTESLIHLLPLLLARILLAALAALFLIDFTVTFAALHKMRVQNEYVREIALGIKRVSRALDNVITRRVEKHMKQIFPTVEDEKRQREQKRREKEARACIFAYGCSFHKLVWLFFLGAFLGDLIETVFCWATMGELMSRSSVVYGPFSIVWGAGIAGFTFLLHRYQEKKDRSLFFLGTVLGGVYEYICSVFTELVFGTVFWDYSKIPFNLGGRINLLYCFFWGFAAVIWMKGLYPKLSGWIEQVPMRAGKLLSWLFVVFMTVNMAISGLALNRYAARSNGQPAQSELDELLDERFGDERMERIYPNAILR